MKKVLRIQDAPAPHWVGNGFPVRSLFNYNDHADLVSPFLLLDYAGPYDFPPGSGRRGVGEHPHRGFETVTLVYEGEVAHRDSTGAGGIIGPGDVQWMTAAHGVMHEEFHSDAFVARGGRLEMVQLWINLPARDKLGKPGYQAITASDIPLIALPEGAGQLRVIAGEYAGQVGPARTHTPMNVWDIRLTAGGRLDLDLPEGHTTLLVVLHGPVLVNDEAIVRDAQWVQFTRSGTRLNVEANGDALLLLLSGEPIDEPVVGYGPFVMNTQAEILQAVADLRSGRFGQLGTSVRQVRADQRHSGVRAG